MLNKEHLFLVRQSPVFKVVIKNAECETAIPLISGSYDVVDFSIGEKTVPYSIIDFNNDIMVYGDLTVADNVSMFPTTRDTYSGPVYIIDKTKDSYIELGIIPWS